MCVNEKRRKKNFNLVQERLAAERGKKKSDWQRLKRKAAERRRKAQKAETPRAEE